MRTFTELATYLQPEVTLGKKAGKGICLCFSTHKLDLTAHPHAREVFKEVITEIVQWVSHHSNDGKSPLQADVRAVTPFIQSRTDDFLMIEFWADKSKMDRIYNVVNLLRGRFEFNFESVDEPN